MKSSFKLILFGFVFVHSALAQTARTLVFYIEQAHENNPTLKENQFAQQINLLQNGLTQAQLRKPQVNLTSDYLFAPYFNNTGNLISANPDSKAFGYDVSQTNGGMYASQLNVSVPLLNTGIVKTLNHQNAVQYQLLQNNNKQLIHDLDKSVCDYYIAAFQLQQQQLYLNKIIVLVNDRKKVVEALIEKALMQQTDYLLLEIEINTRQNELQQQQIALSSAFYQLNNSCGINDTIMYELAAPALNKTLPVKQLQYKEKFKLDSLNIITQQLVSNTKYKAQLNVFGNTGLLSSNAATIPHNVGLSAELHN